MTLDDFRALETADGNRLEAQLNWVANTLLGQYSHLRRGQDMTGPVGQYEHGRYVREAQTITTQTVYATVDQLLTGHPFLRLNGAADYNYFHLFRIDLMSSLTAPGEREVLAGDVVIAKVNGFPVPLVVDQAVVDATSSFTIRIGLSK